MEGQARKRVILEHLNTALHARAQGDFGTFIGYLNNVVDLVPKKVHEEIEQRVEKLNKWKNDERAKIVQELQGKSVEEITDPARGAKPKEAGINVQYWNFRIQMLRDVLDENNLLPLPSSE